MKTIESDRVVMVDCDDTLILWDISEYSGINRVTVNCYGHKAIVVPHEKNLKLLRKFAKLGYRIIVWSQSGWQWAEAVSKTLGIDDIVDTCMSKPRYYFDDIPCQEWMGGRIWRDPKNGAEV